jgi:hypothetical protein
VPSCTWWSNSSGCAQQTRRTSWRRTSSRYSRSRTLKHEFGVRREATAERRRGVHEHDPVGLGSGREAAVKERERLVRPGHVLGLDVTNENG